MHSSLRRILVFVVGIGVILLSSVNAAIHTSVPIDHRVYRILDVAEIRGLIGRQVSTRPYSAKKVLSLLQQIEENRESLSPSEVAEVIDLQQELEHSFGFAESSVDDLLSTGFLRTYDQEKKIGASLGVSLASTQTVNVVTREYDSRNSILAFIKGDLGEAISYNMNFGLQLDKLNSNVFLPTDFTIAGEGFYMQLLDGGSQLRTIPSSAFYTGLALSPELSASLFDGNLNLRWGSIKRDWGPGLNNLMVSGSARSFDGIEIQLDATSWLHYTVINGSLGKFSLKTLDGERFFSDDFNDDKPYYRFDNNFSAHRIELDATPNLTLSIFEGVVWQKRFELGYLNPLTIYMFQQNNLGDIDNMLAGVDFNYTLAKKARFYGSMATTELNKIGSLKTMLTAPRNILAFQAGVTIPLPIGSFSSLTFQWTYLAPFFYSHYPMLEQVGTLEKGDGIASVFTSKRGNTYTYNGTDTITIKYSNGEPSEYLALPTSGSSKVSDNGRIKIEVNDNGDFLISETYSETAYVNKGENLGYPLNPNSQEFLLQLDLGFAQGWKTQTVVKYQVRSGQYGYTVEQFVKYSDISSYNPKDFWANTFEHALTLELQVAKKFAQMPIEVSLEYRFTTLWERGNSAGKTFDGKNTVGFLSWNGPSYDNVVTVGTKIYF
ncbi:hypothetical protein [Sphaerochaeta sp. PS]|uniref:hypothetical protein n=1 Tax=Sphaerochaeta sp. PS TaxID=3076336 RepID=UPI0028A4C34E|nr:hypothetical protein [Sphaerochaeta sp. PS]MDT4761987.1 hypothetical protein [Sphaerochaeta sp. PS]